MNKSVKSSVLLPDRILFVLGSENSESPHKGEADVSNFEWKITSCLR